MRKTLTLIFALLLTLCLLSPAFALEDVTVILDYVANTNHTGMYVALNQGWYEEEGLNVQIIEPTEGATETLIAVGKGQFGISYQENVTVARSLEDPLPIRAIATILQHNTSGFAVAEDSDIYSPADFGGKTYAGWNGAGEEAVLKALMQNAGVPFESLNIILADDVGFMNLGKGVDLLWLFEAWDITKCEMENFPIRYMPLRELDERLDYYTPVIIANEDLLANEPETAKAFLRATAKGYEFAAEHPEEAAQIMHGYIPEYSEDFLTLSQQKLADQYIADAEAFGVMKDSVWDDYTSFCLEYGVIERNVSANELYTNEFLPNAQ